MFYPIFNNFTDLYNAIKIKFSLLIEMLFYYTTLRLFSEIYDTINALHV